MKSVLFKNVITLEHVVCDDVSRIVTISGVDYYYVHKENESRTFLANKSSLTPVKKINARQQQ